MTKIMKKKSLFLGGALMFAMTFSTTVLTSCHDDDKKYEEVEDPLRTDLVPSVNHGKEKHP